MTITDSTGTARIGAFARRTRTVTPRDIALFTELTGDRNPIHYDEEAGQLGYAQRCRDALEGRALSSISRR